MPGPVRGGLPLIQWRHLMFVLLMMVHMEDNEDDIDYIIDVLVLVWTVLRPRRVREHLRRGDDLTLHELTDGACQILTGFRKRDMASITGNPNPNGG